MPGRTAIVPSLAAFLLAVGGLGCAGGSATPTPPPSQPGPAFTLAVAPAAFVGFAIPGARVVFLVTLTGAAADGPAVITAAAAGATVQVEPPQLSPGTVGEVTVVPGAVSEEVPLSVTITAERAGVTRQEERSLNVTPGSDELGPEASAHLAPFITWLAENRPDLGITAETEWDGIPGSWVLIVNHYLFFSSDWEVDLEWHVMVPPDDWSRISLRRRWSEVAPSVAFEISSVSGGTEPHEVEPPEAVWR